MTSVRMPRELREVNPAATIPCLTRLPIAGEMLPWIRSEPTQAPGLQPLISRRS